VSFIRTLGTLLIVAGLAGLAAIALAPDGVTDPNPPSSPVEVVPRAAAAPMVGTALPLARVAATHQPVVVATDAPTLESARATTAAHASDAPRAASAAATVTQSAAIATPTTLLATIVAAPAPATPTAQAALISVAASALATPTPQAAPLPVETPIPTEAPAPTAAPPPVGAINPKSGRPITWLAIPRIHLQTEVVPADLVAQDDSVTWQIPKFVAGHAESTAGAGEVGNAVVLGHLVSRSLGNVFENLNRTRPGDLVRVGSGADEFDYTVTDVANVDRTDVEVLDPTATPTITLVTCAGLWNPILGDYMERLIVRAQLTSPDD
jgi:LPXTG-site transpeptidase (sortase) family protein